MEKFYICDLMILKEELALSLQEMHSRGYAMDNHCIFSELEKMRYLRLQRLYRKIDTMILDMLDASNAF